MKKNQIMFMRKKTKAIIGITFLVLLTIALSYYLYLNSVDSAVLDPKGLIALKERDLMYISTILMLIVIVPVLIMTFAISYRYRASNKDAEYMPDWNHDTMAECIWWGFPLLIIIFLSFVTWKSTHELDPYKPLESGVRPLKVQVVALDWKWLFIYPEQNIATVNYLQLPVQTPVHFEITADAPMNSFWIPDLGGQIYAMPGMNTELHLISHVVGVFRGSSANFSGEGFAGMSFNVKASPKEEFEDWVKEAQGSKKTLDLTSYKRLQKPSEYEPVAIYSLKKNDLYQYILHKYMMPEEHMDMPMLHDNHQNDAKRTP